MQYFYYTCLYSLIIYIGWVNVASLTLDNSIVEKGRFICLTFMAGTKTKWFLFLPLQCGYYFFHDDLLLITATKTKNRDQINPYIIRYYFSRNISIDVIVYNLLKSLWGLYCIFKNIIIKLRLIYICIRDLILKEPLDHFIIQGDFDYFKVCCTEHNHNCSGEKFSSSGPYFFEKLMDKVQHLFQIHISFVNFVACR